MPIIIDDKTGTVKTVTQETIKEVPIDDFFRELTKSAPMTISFLPKKTVGFVTFSNYTGVIVEQAPATLPMNFIHQIEDFNPVLDSEDVTLTYNLHWPFIYWLIGIQNTPISVKGVGMCYAKNPITTEESELGWMVTPNVLAEVEDGEKVGIVCFGEIVVSNTHNLAVCVEDAINTVMHSTFCEDHFNVNFPTPSEDLSHPIDCPLIVEKMKEINPQKILDKDTNYVNYKEALDAYATASELDETPPKTMAQIQRLKSKISPFIHKVYLASIDTEALYLLAWELLTEELTLEEFVDNIHFPQTLTYQNLLDYAYESLGEYNNGTE